MGRRSQGSGDRPVSEPVGLDHVGEDDVAETGPNAPLAIELPTEQGDGNAQPG